MISYVAWASADGLGLFCVVPIPGLDRPYGMVPCWIGPIFKMGPKKRIGPFLFLGDRPYGTRLTYFQGRKNLI